MPAPNAPSSLTATAIDVGQIDLHWTDNSSNEDGFAIERSLDGSTGWAQIETVAAGVTTTSDVSLPDNATRYYRVRAFNVSGDSAYSNVDHATTTLLDPPTLTATTISSSQIDLSWDAVADEGAWQIERSPNGTSGWTIIATVAIDILTYSNDFGLAAATTYYYRVTALNLAGGHSSYSNVANAATLSLLLPPSGLTLTVLSAYRIRLNWTDTNNRESGYAIERGRNADGDWVEVARVGAGVTTWTNYALRPNTHYWFRVRAFVV